MKSMDPAACRENDESPGVATRRVKTKQKRVFKNVVWRMSKIIGQCN